MPARPSPAPPDQARRSGTRAHGLALLLVTTVSWGLNWPLLKYLLTAVPPFTMRAIAALFRTTGPLPNAGPSWNLAPPQDSLVVRRHPETGARHLDLLRRG